MYKTLFIDLDDTLWAFSENAEDTFRELYDRHRFGRYFDTFDHFYALYRRRNTELWAEYADGLVTKEQLNDERFAYPLRAVGVDDPRLIRRYADEFLALIPTRTKLMPHAREALEHLAAAGHHLHILSNGFRELQERKMRAAGILHYFRRIILSEDIGVHKPHAAIFHFALSAAQADLRTSLMIGDSWEADICGAHAVGMPQMYYDPARRDTPLPFRPTHRLHSWADIAATGL